MTQASFNQQLCEFLGAATSPFHAVATMSKTLMAAGYSQLSEAEEWRLEPGGRYFVTRNGSSIIAFNIGSDLAPSAGLRMVGAHTDSPCLMVKPSPEKYREGYLQLAVQVYGGVLLAPWFDRDLSLAGRVSYADSAGALQSTLIDFRRAIATVPSLAIHLDRGVNDKRSINAQTDVVPVLAHIAEGETFDFRGLLRDQLLREQADIDVAHVLDYEMGFYDSQSAAVLGLNDEFIAGARLDNLLSCFTGMQSLISSDGRCSSLLVCNDHEEVGSQSAVGAQGPFLHALLQRLADGDADSAGLIQRSLLISVDNAHGIHPNFPDRHDDNHGPKLNAGPVIKINANQRYATNSETAGMFRLLAARAGVPVQAFVVRNDMGCGSTIGPISSANTGIKTLDVGVPTFAMHSIREMAGSSDAFNLCAILQGFFDFQQSLQAD